MNITQKISRNLKVFSMRFLSDLIPCRDVSGVLSIIHDFIISDSFSSVWVKLRNIIWSLDEFIYFWMQEYRKRFRKILIRSFNPRLNYIFNLKSGLKSVKHFKHVLREWLKSSWFESSFVTHFSFVWVKMK